MDGVGQAQWFSRRRAGHPQGRADPREVRNRRSSVAGIGYGYTLEELGTAQLLGDEPHGRQGDARPPHVGGEGRRRWPSPATPPRASPACVNASTPTATTAPADGTGSATTFASKTPGPGPARHQRPARPASSPARWARDRGYPAAALPRCCSTSRPAGSTRSTRPRSSEWIERNNIYTRTTGQQLTIRGVFGYLDTAGASSSKRMVALSTLAGSAEVPHADAASASSPAVADRADASSTSPASSRLGGVDIRRPKAVRYLDGI